MCALGGAAYFLSHMLFHSDGSEMATAAAYFTLVGVASLIVTFFVTFFVGSILPVVLLAVLVLATVVLTTQGLPMNRNEYSQLAQ